MKMLKCLLQGQHPLGQGQGLGFGNGVVGGHGYLAPDTGTAGLDLLGQLGVGPLHASVFLGHILVGGAENFLVHTVAAGAQLGLGQIFRSLDIAQSQQGKPEQGEDSQDFLFLNQPAYISKDVRGYPPVAVSGSARVFQP